MARKAPDAPKTLREACRVKECGERLRERERARRQTVAKDYEFSGENKNTNAVQRRLAKTL